MHLATLESHSEQRGWLTSYQSIKIEILNISSRLNVEWMQHKITNMNSTTFKNLTLTEQMLSGELWQESAKKKTERLRSASLSATSDPFSTSNHQDAHSIMSSKTSIFYQSFHHWLYHHIASSPLTYTLSISEMPECLNVCSCFQSYRVTSYIFSPLCQA